MSELVLSKEIKEAVVKVITGYKEPEKFLFSVPELMGDRPGGRI